MVTTMSHGRLWDMQTSERSNSSPEARCERLADRVFRATQPARPRNVHGRTSASARPWSTGPRDLPGNRHSPVAPATPRFRLAIRFQLHVVRVSFRASRALWRVFGRRLVIVCQP